MNFVAMTACYAPLSADRNVNANQSLSSKSNLDFEFPISETGDLNLKVWSEWLKHDPVEFLPLRKSKIESLNSIRIYTGNKDEHGLQYGSRKIIDILKTMNVNSKYTELSGTHRSLSQFRCQALMDLIGQ